MRAEFVWLEPVRRVLCLAPTVVALGLLLTSSLARAQEPPPESPPSPPSAPATTTLRGVVTAENDGTPQVGASVTVAGVGALVFTDEKGEYTLTVPLGTHVVRVEVPGAFPIERTVTV